MKCKHTERLECKLTKYLDREITDQDCIFCSAMNASGIARELSLILGEVGAKRHSKHFLHLVADFDVHYDILLELTERNYPKMIKQMKQDKPPVILTPQDLPPEIRKAIEKFTKRGDQYRV